MGYTIIRVLLDLFFFHILRLHVEGEENIPSKGAVIIAANHKSYFDPPLVGVAFHNRRLSYMAKSELFRNPLFGWLIRKLGAFPVKRNSADMGAIRQSVRIIKGGEPLLIFPEGGIVHGRALSRFHPGMAFLAILTGTPVIPAAIIGSEPLPKRKGKLAVLIGKPVEVKKARPDDRNTKELDGLVKERIQAMIDAYEKGNSVPFL
ncbi:1-acyl-sn-glycerol-3-phosphate acyltransferase [uncultured Dialister sp.]|uniref:lysophospholipid acyltransferase family protein n=1 Tax=uncultured Dialister sp. TaxID=278064 RepID=UPI0026343E87|nr:lysophospholipid acyltransferase family protein [uncultured Dialister sp.]